MFLSRQAWLLDPTYKIVAFAGLLDPAYKIVAFVTDFNSVLQCPHCTGTTKWFFLETKHKCRRVNACLKCSSCLLNAYANGICVAAYQAAGVV